MSSALFASPIDARTAPTAVLRAFGEAFRREVGAEVGEAGGDARSGRARTPTPTRRDCRSSRRGARRSRGAARVSTSEYGIGVPVRSQTLNATAPPHRASIARSVDADERRAVGVAKGAQVVDEIARELRHVRGQPRHPDFVEQIEAGVERGDAEEVRRAVFEAFVARAKEMRVGGDGCVHHRSAGEPRAAQTRQRVAPRDQRAEAGRIAEEFVERERREIGRTAAQAQRVTRDERRDVEQDVEAEGARFRDEIERMLDAGEIRLRRKRDQPFPMQRRLGEQQLRIEQAQIGDRAAGSERARRRAARIRGCR